MTATDPAARALRPGRSWPAPSVVGLAAVAATAALVLSGCTGGPDGEPDRVGAEERVVASVPVGELDGLDGALQVGQEIHVLVDTPDIDWTVTSSFPEVAEVVEDPDADPRIVRIVAAAAGEAEVGFAGSAEGARDAVVVTVEAE